MYRKYYRNHISHRDGADVSFADIVKYFGFRTAHTGRNIDKTMQQRAANLFFDALCDLADILQVPTQVISLRGTLSIAYGSGGTLGAKAHYSPSTRTLCLARNAGGGALAHEWFHAFDHFIADKMYQVRRSHSFASEIWLNDIAKIHPHPLNAMLSNAFSAIFLHQQAPSRIVRDSIAADKQLKCYYYARPQELSARVFEACCQAHDIKNSYLVAGTILSKEARLGVYPDKQHVNLVWPHFSQYFTSLGEALLAKA